MRFAALLIAALPAVVLAQKPTPTPLSSGDLYKQTAKATVWVMKAEEFAEGLRTGVRVTGTGSGSLIDLQNRLVVTNYHVVRDNKLAVLFFPAYDAQKNLIQERKFYSDAFKEGKGARSQVIAVNPKADLALIQLPINAIPAGTRELKLAKESVGPGDTVHSIGHPGAGALWSYTPGSVKAVTSKKFMTTGREGREAPITVDARVVETTSPVNPGDSGGPLVNAAGELAAITQGHVAEDAARSISYFIDVSELKALLKKHNFKVPTAPPVAEVVAAPKDPPPPKAVTTADTADADKKAKEARARSKLTVAENFKDNTAKYKAKLQEIVKDFDGTEAATEAKKRLDEMK